MLCLRITTNEMIQNIELVSIISIICLLAYVIVCFEENISAKLLDFKPETLNYTPKKIQKVLENLAFLYTRARGNERKARLLLSGFIEELQRRKDLDANSPLLFTSVWKEDKVFSKYIEREDRAFLHFISNQYLAALKK